MKEEIVRRISPEEEEFAKKRGELAVARAALAERELELTDLRAQLKSFEGRYLRQVGVLYAELDDWEAKIAEIEASLNPSATASQRARETRKRAEEAREATHGEASKARDFQPSADLKSLFREAARRLHPDFAKDEADRLLRTRLMAQANHAYSQGDAEVIQRILDEFGNSPESQQGEGIGVELVRIIRQRISGIPQLGDAGTSGTAHAGDATKRVTSLIWRGVYVARQVPIAQRHEQHRA